MNHHLEKNCEGVDASVFSGDVLYDDESRNELKEYIGRWTRAIAEHEGAAVQAAQPEAVGLCERICEAIKAADDKSMNEAGYMLDSTDCIAIVRQQFASAPTPEPMSAPTAEAVATARPSAEWYAKKIQETDDLDNFLPCGALATPPSAATPEPSDAERYQLVRRGQHWSVIDGIGNVLRGDDLDTAVDAIRATKGGKL